MRSPDRGFLTMAVGPRRYLEMAVDMALSLREHTRLPIALATDEPLASLARGVYARAFDHVVLLSGRFRQGRALKYGSAEASPFRETVFVDADCIVLGSLDSVFDVLRSEPMAMLGERLGPGDDRSHHGFSTRALMKKFGLDVYLKTNSGIFAFRRPEALPLMEECLSVYLGEVRPRLRWQALRGRWLGDEITFGIVGGRRGFGVLPEPGPMFWPDEFPDIDLAHPARPLLHLIHPPPEPVLADLLAAAAARRARAGVPDGGQAHLRDEVARLRRSTRTSAPARPAPGRARTDGHGGPGTRSLDVAFVVQGEGRGHMTQALAVRDFLADAGHRVVAVYLGTSPAHPAPEYFATRIGAPVTTFLAPTLIPDRDLRGMSVGRTAAYNARHLPAYVAEGLRMRKGIRRHAPDVVVNFYDLIAGFVHAFSSWPSPPPRVAIAHAYLMGHPGSALAPAGALGRLGLALLSRVAAVGAAAPFGLSFDELPDAPGVRVAPPLMRPGLDRLRPTDEGYLLAYALNAGYAREVASWQARHPEVHVHCYVPGGGEGLSIGERSGFDLHDLDDERFLSHLAGCRAYVGTAGFESVCEAFYLGKPVLAVPVGRHYEQAFNAADIRRVGIGVTGGHGDLDVFWSSLPVPSPDRVSMFRRWVARAPEIIVGAIEDAARGRR